VGNGNDYALVAPGANLITQTVGSFPSVSGVTSESGVGVASFGGGGILGPNEYSLQLNTNSNSTTSACSGGAPGCTVWQQFIYGDASTSGSKGVFISYWLLGYGANGASCPSGYQASKSSCFKNSSSVSAPDVPITGLGNLKLAAAVVSGGNDTVTFANGTTAYSVSASDSVLKIAPVWNQSEFNVVGDGDGSEAVFNTGSVITLNVAAQYGSTTAPTCAAGAGTTGETNNLNLLPCSATGGTTPSIQFTESNGPILSVTSSALIFLSQQGGSAQSQSVQLGGTTGVAWQAMVATSTGGGWLSVQPGTGQLPASLTASVNPAGLPLGTYQGTITVQAPVAFCLPSTPSVYL
jgi:hypothetical protein